MVVVRTGSVGVEREPKTLPEDQLEGRRRELGGTGNLLGPFDGVSSIFYNYFWFSLVLKGRSMGRLPRERVNLSFDFRYINRCFGTY